MVDCPGGSRSQSNHRAYSRLGPSATQQPCPFPDWVSFRVLRLGGLGVVPASREDDLALLAPRSCEKRRKEFALGRAAARQALAGLGLAVGSIPVGRNREPIWPEGIRGSITHSSGLAAALVARSQDTTGIGIDLEDSSAVRGADIESLVAFGTERHWTRGDPVRVTMLFSAKEAVFKALYRFRQDYFDFGAVVLAPSETGFAVRLQQHIGGRWRRGARLQTECRLIGSLVLSWVVLASDGQRGTVGEVGDDLARAP